MPTTRAPAARRGVRAGVVSFVSSLMLMLWVGGLIYLATLVESSETAAGTATVLFFVSWVVIPVLAVTALVSALIALLLNKVPGKILGSLAIVLPVAGAVVAFDAVAGLLS